MTIAQGQWGRLGGGDPGFPLSHVTRAFSWDRWAFHDPWALPMVRPYRGKGAGSPLAVYPRGWREKTTHSLFRHRCSYWNEPSLHGKVLATFVRFEGCGYRKIAGFPLVDLKAEGLYWGVFSMLWCSSGSREGMLIKCFEQGSADVRVTYRKTCVVKWFNKSQYISASIYWYVWTHIKPVWPCGDSFLPKLTCVRKVFIFN